MNKIIELLSPSELFISILQIDEPKISESTNIPNSVISFINEIISQLNRLPIDFKLLRKIMQKDETTAFSIGIQNLNLKIKYPIDFVQTLAIVNFPGDDSIYSALYSALFIFLQWFSTKDINDPSFPFLFPMLNKFSNYKDLRQITLCSYIYLFQTYIESKDSKYSNEIFHITYDFYSKNVDLPIHSYSILKNATTKFFNKQSATLDQPEIEFFSFVDMLASERSNIFPNEVVETCIKCMSMNLSQFGLLSTTFFTHLIDKVSIKFSSSFFILFPVAISSFVMENPPSLTIEFPEIIEEEEDSPELKSSSDSNTKKKEFDFEISFALPESSPISNFILGKIKYRLDMVLKAAELKTELIVILIDDFTTLLSKMSGSPYLFDLLAILLYMTSHFLPVYNVNFVSNVINESPIFDQRINIINQSGPYQIISSFRSAAFDFCCRNNILHEFINSNIKKPLILAEILQKIIQSDFVIVEKQKTLIVKSAITAELQFQKLVYYNKGIQVARASIFVLLSRFLADISYSNKFFSVDWFCTVFILSFLLEKPLRSFVLSSTRNYLTNGDGKNNKVILNYGNAINILSASLPSEESLDLLFEIVTMLTSVASAKPSIIDDLSVIREKVAISLSVLARFVNDKDNSNPGLLEKSREYFIKSIQFFAQTSSVHIKTAATSISAFDSIVSSLFSAEIPDHLFGKIIQLLSGSLTPSISSNFTLREPKFVCFFLKFFKQDSDKYIQALSFVIKLCEFSRENCILCHKEKVDSYLIEDLVSMKENYDPKLTKENEIIDLILTLLCSIASIVSSVSFVHQCFSLFTPIYKNNEKFISLLQPKFINTVSQIINKTINNPSASFPLLSKGPQMQFSVDTALLNSKGFSFTFWICLDSSTPQYMPNIFSIVDGNGLNASLFFNSNNLMIQFKTKKTTSTGIFDKAIPLRSWTFISVNFIKNASSPINDIVCITINEKPVKELYYPKITYGGSHAKFTIGGTIENSIDTERPALLATFGLFQILDLPEVSLLTELGPKLNEIPISITKFNDDVESEDNDEEDHEKDVDDSSIDDKLILVVKTTNLNNQLKLDFVSTDSNPRNYGKVDLSSFVYIEEKMILNQNPNFTNVLLSSIKVDNLIPFFSQHDLKYVNGEPYSPQCEELSLLVLGSVLASSYDAQKSMAELNGFDLICHLFTVSNSGHFTYKLYTKFFNLYQTCSYVPLQKQIFNNMLFNFDLLMKTSPIDHLLILKHWNRSLFPAVLSHQIEEISFKNIVIGLVVYYWDMEPQYSFYQRNENELLKNLDLEKCRKCLIDVAFQVSQFNFNDDDITTLISLISNCPGDLILDSLLSLLKSLILSSDKDGNFHLRGVKKTGLKYNKQNQKAKNELALILYLLNHKKDVILANTIDLLIMMINNKIITNITLPEIVDIVIWQITPDMASEILLQHIIALMIDGTYELLSICMYFSFVIGADRLKKFIQTIQPSSLYCLHLSWSFWPILICFKLINNKENDDLINSILLFLLECDFNQWVNIMVMIDFVGKFLSYSDYISDIKLKFLNLLSEHVLKSNGEFSEVKSKCLTSIELILRFIFFRNETDENSVISYLYNSSPFSNNKYKKAKSLSVKQAQSFNMEFSSKDHECLLDVSKIFEKFLKEKINPTKPRFGIRISKFGNLTDIDLARSCLNIFNKYASLLISTDANYCIINEVITAPILILSAFLVRENYDNISLIRPVIRLAQNNSESSSVNDIDCYISYIEYAVKMMGKSEIFGDKSCFNLASQTLDKLKSIELKNIISTENKLPNQLKYFFENNWKKSISIFSLLNEKIVLKSACLTRDFLHDIKLKRKEDAKKWDHLWRSLAFNERAPWNDGIETIPFLWSRDFSSCYCTIPYKLKRNWHNEKSHVKSDVITLEDKINESIKEEKKVEYGNLKGSYECEIIKVSGVCKGELFIYPELLQFISKEKTKIIYLRDIRNIYLRNRIHLATSIEIFLINGQSYFINFINTSSIQIMNKISKLTMTNLQNIQLEEMETYFKIHSLTEDWVSRKISNFEYLMHLNLMSGRSFNDLSQYPVFPWVIADYESKTLDLTDKKIYRDLSKPIGALNESKLNKIRELSAQMKESEGKNHLYTSGFLYPNIIMDYLYHIEPFTTLHKNSFKKENNYFMSVFQSISKIWNQIYTKINDNWELIPEFYSTPELLNNISLPPWSSSPLDFVYKMRKALESDYVSENLNHWIDLIWGIKQRSEKDDNLFISEAYSDIWKSLNLNINSLNVEDDFIESIKVSLLNICQVPPQLFSIPHPARSMKVARNFDWIFLSYQTEVQNVSSAFFMKIASKIIIVMITNSIDKIYKCTLSKKTQKNSKSISRTKSSIDIKTSFSQLFDVSISSKEIKKKFPKTYLDQKHIFSFLKPSTLLFSVSGSSDISLINVNTGNHSEISMQFSEASAIDSGNDYFVVACRNSVINVFKSGDYSKNNLITDKASSMSFEYDDAFSIKSDNSTTFNSSEPVVQIASIASYRSKLPCVAISEKFNLIVNGTSDGFLVISSLTSLDVEKIVGLGEDAKPILISISPSWGFIVVYTSEINSGNVAKYLLVFNVNGELISKNKVDFSISSMVTFSDYNSFDQILISDSTGGIYISEIYKLDFSSALFRFHDKIIDLFFNNEDSSIYAISACGKIYVYAKIPALTRNIKL